MNRQQFENEARLLINRSPAGYNDFHWRIKYDDIDREYFIRWTNGIMDKRHSEFTCFFKNDEFIYY
jgi:hypothetical protein